MKKKGLIISTAVMVVVLIAALTTSTFAWFSQSAEVKVSDVTIATQAVEGLQIAFVVNSEWGAGTHADNQLIFGDQLTYDTAWKDGTNGWGGAVGLATTQTAGFASMEHAVTKATQDILDQAATNGLSGTGVQKDDFIVPTGYDSSIKPLGYKAAVMNTNYLTLPIVLRATTATVAQIYYTITITPVMNTAPESLYPGMAAAARMDLTINSGEEKKVEDTNLTQPFNDAKLKGNNMVVSGGDDSLIYKTKHTTASRQTSWIYSGLIYGDENGESKTAIDALKEIQFFLTIWIEGTDGECINVTAGTGFTVDIKFGYKKTTETLLKKAEMGVDIDLSSGD